MERGDVTNVGVGGNDGVVQMLRFDLHNDGTMMPTWKDTVSQDSSYIVGKESDVVGDESESASKLIDLLLGTKVEYRRDSFSPHDKNSAWNRDENNQYAPLLWPYREVVLAVAITPKGKEPTLNDWTFIFEGFLGENIGMRQNGSIVSVQAKSKAKLLQDTLIETEQEYGSNDEDVSVESVMQAIIDNNLGPGVVSLYCPVPSQAYVRPYVVKDKTVWDALQELAGKVGWFLGDRWDPQTKQHRLTFMEPPIDKNASTADFRFSWTSDFYIQELDQTDRHYRNAIIVEYWDEELGRENTVEVSQELEPGMVRRAAKFGLGKTDLIRTEAEAIRFAKAALHDLSDDTTLSRVTMPLFPQLDTFHGVVINNPRVASEDLFFGVDTVRHTLDFVSEKFTTEFVGSGKVVGGREKWRRMQTRPGLHEPTKPEDIGGGGIALPAPKNVNVRSVMGGVEIDVPPPPTHSWRWSHTEIYLSENPGFTPGPTTLVSSGRNTTFSLGGMAGGITVYVRAAYVDAEGKRGPYSDEVQGETGKVEETPDLTPPAKPTGLVAIPVVGGFVLTWDHHSPPPPLDRWILQRASSEDDYATWQTVNDEIRSAFYTDVDGISYDHQYKYRLIAVSRAGLQSEPSDETTPNAPGKVSLASQVIGRLARGQLAEEIIAELDGIVQIQEDLEDLSGDVSAVVQTAQQLSQAVAQVEEGLITAQSEIQQNADNIALRLQGVRRKDIVKARFGQLPSVNDVTLQAGLTLDNEPVDFEDLLDGKEPAYVEVVVRRSESPGGWDDTSGPLFLTGSITGLVRGASEYLAYGQSNDDTAELHKSPDGRFWTNITEAADFDVPMHDIVYSKKYGYVGVGEQADAYAVTRSTDGVNWSTKWFMYGEALYSIACDPGTDLLVAVGYDWNANQSLCLWSDDGGLTWHWSNLNDTVVLWGVTHGDAGFVATGESGTVWRSADGKNWTKVAPFTVSDFWRVFWTGLEYVAILFSDGLYSTSPDGLNWTTRYSGVSQSILSVVGIGDLRLMGTIGSVLYSYDGQTWEQYIAAPYGFYRGAAASETEAVMVADNGQVIRYVLPQEEVAYEVGQVVSYTSNTLTLDRPWTEENVPSDIAGDYFILWYYEPVTSAQILIARVDGEGLVLIDGTTVVGRLIIREDLKIQTEDGTFIFDVGGIQQIGPDGTTTWSPSGLSFTNPLGETLGYVRGVKYGIAEDGDYVPLPFVNMPHVLLQPYDIMTYDPAVPERQRIVIQALDVSPEGFRVYAKTVAEAGGGHTEQFPKTTAYHPGQVGYCRGDSGHGSAKSYQWSDQSIFSVNEARTYTTVNSDVTKITVLLTEMMHVSAFAGFYSARNKLTYQIRVRPVGSPTWTRTYGPITRQLTTIGQLFTPYFTGTHREAVVVIDNLPPDQYEFEVRIIDKVIDSSNGYNSNSSCWLLVDGWIESASQVIEPTYKAKVMWMALESNTPGRW